MTAGPLSQLTLALFARPGAEFADYHPGANAEAVCALEAWANDAGSWSIYLWGNAGVGKSHLLQAALRHAGERGLRAMYVPLREVAHFGPAILEDLDSIKILGIDDLDAVAGQPEWERALFALYNRALAAAQRLATTAVHAPRRLALGLPDLQSRLSAGLIYHLQDLGDDDKRAALQQAAARRGFALPEPVANFILRRVPRDMGGLISVLDVVDRASLAQRRHLTVPFVRQVLGLGDGE